MKILVIGGTYFLGRVFTEMAAKSNEITLINRGTHPCSVPDATVFHLDRHDKEALAALPDIHYDSVVDLCAYAPGDIRLIFENMRGGFDRYIFVSTVDVYKRGTGEVMTEASPTEDRYFGGAAGDYIAGKILLERELRECAKDVGYTIVRPSFICGPGNYAPREGIFFEWIDDAGMILLPSDSTGSFQLVSVYDVARGILACCSLLDTSRECINICPDEILSYESFADRLDYAVGKEVKRATLSTEEINERQIPLPFPLTKEESVVCSGKKSSELLGLSYTPTAEILRQTYLANKP